MSFIQEFNKKYEERNKFIKSKETEVLDNTNKLVAAKEAVERANREYFLNITDETLSALKNAKNQLKLIEEELKESEEELIQIKRNFLFVCDPKDVYGEAIELYAKSGLDSDIDKKNKLENEIEKLKSDMFEKWVKVENQVTQITGKINKLYLSDQERSKLCAEIDNYIDAAAWKLIEQGISAYHTKRHEQEIISNSMEKKNKENTISYR